MSAQRTRSTGYLSLIGACCLLGGCCMGDKTPPMATPPVKPAPAPTAAAKDGKIEPQFAYAAGMIFAHRVSEQLKADGLTVDNDLIVQGVRDGLTGNPPRYSQDQMDDAMSRVETAILQRRAEKQYAADPSFKKMADENLKSSQQGIARYAMRSGTEADASGIFVTILTPGTGRYVANATSVSLNFDVSLIDGTVLQQADPAKPRDIPMVRLPPAIASVMRGLRVGDKARLAIPADKAFGLAGRPPQVGPNQALLIDLEILSAK